ncbi:hypothetical protein RHSP_05620 [Rhizobium freirei PRF 81]|uniref:Urease-associated protein n=1 Tax=Rhizobium freirei PRF 81 TaxID=363754 RepID=N6UVF3_9HYPH|nr:glycosyltransferase family 29 protein [Rhizobium freirei]ENN85640.1 hypothetical protein RHSP_05620 [Rhizobium freirei PRF 81]
MSEAVDKSPSEFAGRPQLARKTAIIIGNGRLDRDLSKIIDGAEFVMRFNEPNLSDDRSGSRTDVLMLAASSKALHKRMVDPAFLENAALKSAKILMLAYHPEIIRKYHPQPNIFQRLRGRRADWTAQAIELMGHAGKEIRIMPPQFYAEGCAELGIAPNQMRTVFPSTGFLGIRYALANFPAFDWDIRLCGFGWKGWARHDWQGERAWVEDKLASGRIGMLA